MNIELLAPDKKLLIKAAVQICEKLNDSPMYYAEAEYSNDSGMLHAWVIPKEEPLLHVEGVIVEHLFPVAESKPEFDNQFIDGLRGLLK
jgi:hypothetical protein